jgi:hypothetical protein
MGFKPTSQTLSNTAPFGWNRVIPAAEIDRAVAFQRRWGGLVLPPAPQYDGGPRYFGIHEGRRWVPLHASGEGWVESLALAHHAANWAKQITKVTGETMDRLELHNFEPVTEVRGLADTWWRGTDSLVAIYSGESNCLGAPVTRTGLIYSGLDEWGLCGGV